MTISILGCGWLGLPLASALAAAGHRIKGSTTQEGRLEAIRAAGAEAFILTVEPPIVGSDDFFQAETLFLNIPPGRSNPETLARFVERVRAVRNAAVAGGVTWIVFASSTSVYAADAGNVTEETPPAGDSASALALRESEQLLLADSDLDTTILRFGGLYGRDRQPGRFLAGRRALAGGHARVNLVHQEDAVRASLAVITADARNEIFNICADEHPTRAALYGAKARELGLEPPEFADGDTGPRKIVRADKLKRSLGFRFLYPDPLAPAP